MEDLFLSSGTDFGPGGHRYNDDLLLAADARERAQKEHASVFHLLDHYELRQAFRQQNDPANLAKKHAHVAGFWAVTSAFLALAVAAGEPLWGGLTAPLPRLIAIASAGLGVVSLFISAVWLLYGKRKAVWLHKRLYTERLRQFHFQSFVWRLSEMAGSLVNGEESRRDYRTLREGWFKSTHDELQAKGDAQMSALLHPTAVPRIWLHDNAVGQEPVVPDASNVNLQAIFRAYEVFRFDEQQGYAEFVLRASNNPSTAERNSSRHLWWYPGINQPVRIKRTVLNAVWIVALTALLLMHVGVLIAHIGGWQAWQAAWTHVTIVWFALLAVSVKTLSEGFALMPEIERYEEYRAVVSGLKQAFQATDNPATKLRIMIDMEKASFEEMRAFVRSHHDATFIM